MAKLTSSKTDGRNSRFTDLFNNRPIGGIGYTGFPFKGLSLQFSGRDDKDYNEETNDNPHRSYNLILSEDDFKKILRQTTNDNPSLGDLFSDCREMSLAPYFAQCFEAIGLTLSRYKYPYKGSNRSDYMYVDAFSVDHAAHKLNKWMPNEQKPIDLNKIERVEE